MKQLFFFLPETFQNPWLNLWDRLLGEMKYLKDGKNQIG